MNNFKSSKLLVIILMVLDLTIAMVAIKYYRMENERFKNEIARQFRSIAEMKVNQIVDWRHERLSDARFLSKNQEIAYTFRYLLREPDNLHYKRLLLNNLNAMFLNGKYEAMLAVDRFGMCFFSIPDHKQTTLVNIGNTTAGKDDYGPIVMGEMNWNEQGTVRLPIKVPILDVSSGDTLLMGHIFLIINPQMEFFKLLQSVPMPSKPLEVLLVRREKDSVVYLNRLKSPDISGGISNQPGSEAPIAFKAVSGYTGTAEGIDETGKLVVAAMLPVRESKWHLIVKMDRSEAYADLRKIRINTIAFSLMLIVSLTSSVSLFWLRYQDEIKNLELDRKMISERYDMLSKYANDAILLYNNNLEILQVNDIVLEKYGYSREELIGMSVDLLRSPKTRGDLKNKLAEIIRSGGLQFETVHQRKDGSEFPVEVSTRYVEIHGRSCFQSIIREITERKQIEQALLESEERLRMITNSLPQIVWTAKPNGTFDFVNSRFEALTGLYPYKDNALRDSIHLDDFVRISEYWKRALREEFSPQFEFRLRMKDGSYRWFLNMGIPLHDNHGRIIKWFGSATDIDDLKRTEKEILILNAELEDRVSQRTAELEAFTFSVSHDLRAPLRAIKGFSQMLLEEYGRNLNQEGQRLLETVSINAHQMGLLIDDLLRLSRTSRQELTISRINMNELFKSLIDETRIAFPEHRITVKLEILPETSGDLALLKQVISNLLSNAVKFSGKQKISRIEIGHKTEKHETVFYVKDNGTGFDMHLYPKLFGVFQRLHNGDEFEGTGVGLALVKRIIEKHGGRVWAESEPGKGAIFYFSLPDFFMKSTS